MSAVHRSIRGANACYFQSSVNEAMDALRIFHSAANDVEWYERTLNNTQKTESVVLWFVIWLCGSSLPCNNPSVIMISGATRWVQSAPSVRRFLRHPAMTDLHHICLILSNMLTDFSEE
ncbi:hypothetical protein TNCV_1001061 [Trichonephila clavipes]|nr:hypothetical protein TNCV_1001061 [Trichonephila clavipes]